MESEAGLQEVTRKLLRQFDEILDEGSSGLSELKQMAAVLKDIRDIQKEVPTKETAEGGFRVVLEGEVAQFGG